MNILIAPDKFKGSLSATALSKIIATELRKKGINAIIHPLADGGDGSLELLKSYVSLKEINIQSLDPLGRTINAVYLCSNNTAFIELATASGYALLEDVERNPMITSTLGTGILIKDAISKGFKKIVLFLGGSATNDAGIGILAALGFTFYDTNNKELHPSGESLRRIYKVTNPEQDLSTIEFTLLCDVNNPLYGPQGAAHVYSRQKGATEEQVLLLDQGLEHFAKYVKQNIKKSLQEIPGCGAAGGIPGGLLAFLNTKMSSGSRHFMKLTGFEEMLENADLVITGEGCLDGQSLSGKVPGEVYGLALSKNKPVVFLVGTCRFNELPKISPDSVYSVDSVAQDENDAFTNAARHVSTLTQQLVQDLEMRERWL